MEKLMAIQGQVLLVEDHPVNREIAVAMLERMGCDVAAAASGADAVQQCADQRFDLVLMDIQMPGMDGIEATLKIREMERSQARAPVPIVALTANAGGEDRQVAMAAGMNDYLVKPIGYGGLLGMVSRWVSGGAVPGGVDSKQSAGEGAVDLAAIRALPGTLGVLSSPRATTYVQLFLDETRRQMDVLAEALGTGDEAAAARHCHRLKSAAAAVGALEVARLARELESACRAYITVSVSDAFLRQMRQALRCYHETVKAAGVVVSRPLD